MKRIFTFVVVCVLILALCLSSCASPDKYLSSDESTPVPNNTEKESVLSAEDTTDDMKQTSPSRDQIIKKTIFSPTVYSIDAIVNAEQTVAGSFEAWQNEVFNGKKNNDDPTENSVISSPFHKLSVNGTSVPVYTARCGKGAHSFAWIDISSNGQFLLDVKLELSIAVEKCVVLPESRKVEPSLENNFIKVDISDTGSFTFTFAKNSLDEATDPTLAPLTLMVTRADKLMIPDGYKKVEIAPGYHENDELEFTQGNTLYVVKAGFHSISSIGLPSNSILYIEQGAYIQVEDRNNADGSHNTKTAIHADDVSNVKIISRGLLDCGKLQGGDAKYKHVINTSRSKNVLIKGLTVINSNTWTVCAYNSENPVIENNLLLSYRTYSDGIMMSECTGGIGRYNFVRTGDDAIEFKGTGWWDATDKTGSDCLYEYNDIWTDKGAGYCLTWESERPMNKMIFRNNSVGFAQPTWTDRNTAIDCLLGTNASTEWSAITFENIEIYHVISPNAINIQVQGKGAVLKDIVFKNITVGSAEDGVYAFRMHFSAEGGGIYNILLDNVRFCGKRLTSDDVGNEALFCNQAPNFFTNLTVK